MLLLKEGLKQNDSNLDDVLDNVRSSQEDNLRVLMWLSDITYGSDPDQIRATLRSRYATSGQCLSLRVDQWLQSCDSSVA